MDLLIRDISPATKLLLQERAARHNTSQQKEAKAILEASLQSTSQDWVLRLRNAAASVGGIEWEQPERHPARDTDTAAWS